MVNIWASICNFGSFHIDELRLAYAYAQLCQIICCSHTQLMDVDEDSEHILDIDHC